MKSLKPNTSYHIFNHANGFENIFREDENYRFYLEKYTAFISPVAETYAYCLLPNHFHLVVRIRKREVIEELILNKNNSTSNIFSNLPKVGKVEISEYEIENSYRNNSQIYLAVIRNRLIKCTNVWGRFS